MNNKGFAITTILYGTLILFLMLLLSMLGILSTYKDRLSLLIDSNNGARDIINGNYIETETTGTAYAVYSEDDKPLTFYRSVEPITSGSTYKGKTVTAVYTGFEQSPTFDSPPWSDYSHQIKKVIVEHTIMPISMDSWFIEMYDCESFNLEKLDTSKVTNMSYLFGRASTSTNVESLELIGLEDWTTSNVTNMEYVFDDFGSSVDYLLDLSDWDVSSVTTYDCFENNVEDKIISPWD